jgi:hypothetical protein
MEAPCKFIVQLKLPLGLGAQGESALALTVESPSKANNDIVAHAVSSFLTFPSRAVSLAPLHDGQDWNPN